MNRSPVGNPIKGFPENLVFVQFDSRRILFRQTAESGLSRAIGSAENEILRIISCRPLGEDAERMRSGRGSRLSL